ncbi:MAG: methyl-accepting chemotaxis protein [Firmicutes bacterium]|nr:methyl-accepting chemotaxis protein [Bacillota bacterium]
MRGIKLGLKLNSLKAKLVLIIIIASGLALGTVSFLNYNKASGILEEQLYNAAANSAVHNADIVEQWLQGIKNEVNTLALDEYIINVGEESLPVLKAIANAHDDYELAYVSDANGDCIGSNDTTFSITDRDYFQEVMQTGNTVISDPLESKATGKQIIVIVAPTYKDGSTTPTGLVGVTPTLDYLKEVVAEMNINGYGYGFIQNSDMMTIAHLDDQWIGNSKIANAGDNRLNELVNNMTTEENGAGAYSYQGVEKMLSYGQVPSTGWAVAQSADVADVMAPLQEIRSTNVSVAGMAILVMIGIALLIAGFIAKPLVKLSLTAEAIAGGDLTVKVDTGRDSNDEIGVLAKSFGKMVENLKSMISSVQDTSEKLASHSQQMASSSEEVSATVEEVASTTNEVAATSGQGAENAEEAAKDSEQVQHVAEEGNKAVQETVEKMQSISQSSQNVATAVKNLGEQSNQIGEIISTITNIADQTNLLALNAAIEAARAGEHGRGFAVVAEEVRKLAEQSAGAAGEITGLIEKIQVGVGEAVTAIDSSVVEVDDGVQVANNAGASLEQIIKAIEKNTAVIQDVAAGSNQANEGMQQLSASNEQITSTVQQISSAAQELANIAGELQNEVIKFKLDGASNLGVDQNYNNQKGNDLKQSGEEDEQND